VPTTLSPDGRNRPPHLRTWRDGWRHLLFMLLFTPRWLFLIPGTVLAGGGLIGMVALARGPQVLGPMGLDVHSMLYCSAALIIGAQLVHFALLVKWIAVVAGIVREPRWVTQARRHTSVEFGLVIGALVFLADWPGRWPWSATGGPPASTRWTPSPPCAPSSPQPR
jgi:hypothetical protein